ncbi:MAG: hypothetical protein IJ125_06170 [Atopobiaceae bacterium]|nr:hypothetical protein [Atopobiaceae bacterium]
MTSSSSTNSKTLGSARRQSKASDYSLNRSKKASPSRLGRLEPKEIALLVGALLLLILLIVGIASCARSCTSPAPQEEPAVEESSVVQQLNPQDSRVAFGTSTELTTALSAALDKAEAIQYIAEHANEYPEGLVELALREESAIDFVRNYASASKTGDAFEDPITQGTVPPLFCFDKRWGAVDYNGKPLALAGSGPTCLSMAYMGLTGRSDATPAVLAQLAVRSNQAKGDSGTDPDFFIGECGNMNIGCIEEEVAAGILMDALYQRNVVLAQVKANTLTDEAHWVLVCGYNENGAVIVYDPTSTEVSSHEWDAATVSTASNKFLTLTPAAEGYGEGYSYYIGQDDPVSESDAAVSGSTSSSSGSSDSSSSTNSSSETQSSSTDENSSADETSSEESSSDSGETDSESSQNQEENEG